jgi:hypothetical protein
MNFSNIRDYLLGYLDGFRSYVDGNQRDIIVILCGATLLAFILALTALMRGRRLKRELEELRQLTQTLFFAEEARNLREFRGNAGAPADGRPAGLPGRGNGNSSSSVGSIGASD